MNIETTPEALTLFKDHSFLQLKTILVQNTIPFDGEERAILKEAISLYRVYMSTKIGSTKKENNVQ